MSRTKLAGIQHSVALITELIGFVGWLVWRSRPEYHVCDCKKANRPR